MYQDKLSPEYQSQMHGKETKVDVKRKQVLVECSKEYKSLLVRKYLGSLGISGNICAVRICWEVLP